MENNVMFYFKIKIKDAIKLHLWTNSTVKSLMSLNHLSCISYVFENGKIYAEEYPFKTGSTKYNFQDKESALTWHFIMIFLVFFTFGQGTKPVPLGSNSLFRKYWSIYCCRIIWPQNIRNKRSGSV